jgi:hypothetical protein
VILLTCDLIDGHDGDHHGIRRTGEQQHIEIEMTWTDEQAIPVE